MSGIFSIIKNDQPTRNRVFLQLITFILVWIISYISGVRFDMTPLDSYYQFLDPDLLKNDLTQSILNLHSQPPIMNLATGIVLKAFAPLGQTAVTWAFHTIFTILALTLYIILFNLMVEMKISKKLSFILSTIFIISPPMILHSHQLFYTIPIALLITSAVYFFAKHVKQSNSNETNETNKTNNPLHAWAAITTTAILCLTASIFHLIYFAVASALILLISKNKKKILLPVSIFATLILLLYLKNLILFASFSSSTWTGMNLWSTTGRNIPIEKREELVENKLLSPISSIERFSPINRYNQFLAKEKGWNEEVETEEKKKKKKQAPQLNSYYPAATREEKKSSGETNFNHLKYIHISNIYLIDSITAIKEVPQIIIKGQLRSYFSYLTSASDGAKFNENLDKIKPWNNLWQTIFQGKLPINLNEITTLPIYSNKAHHIYLLLLLGIPFLLIYGVIKTTKTNGKIKVITIFLLFNILYIAIIGNLMETGENNRFRFYTDPLYMVLLGVLLTDMTLWFKKKCG